MNIVYEWGFLVAIIPFYYKAMRDASTSSPLHITRTFFKENLRQTAKMQQQSSILFRIPLEVRLVIYKQLARRDGNLKLELWETVESRMLHNRKWNVGSESFGKHVFTIVPYLNGLSQTCRQAYVESNHLLYKLNNITFSNIRLVEALVGTMDAATIQHIQELTILSIQRFNLFDVRMDAPSNSTSLACPRQFKLLRNFEDLKTLRLRDEYLSFRRPSKENTIFGMRNLLSGVSPLTKLQLIILKSRVDSNEVRDYLQVTLGYDDLPGWNYSCRRNHEYESQCFGEIIETLRRVMGSKGSDDD